MSQIDYFELFPSKDVKSYLSCKLSLIIELIFWPGQYQLTFFLWIITNYSCRCIFPLLSSTSWKDSHLFFTTSPTKFFPQPKSLCLIDSVLPIAGFYGEISRAVLEAIISRGIIEKTSVSLGRAGRHSLFSLFFLLPGI